jgi:hypothetical protein
LPLFYLCTLIDELTTREERNWYVAKAQAARVGAAGSPPQREAGGMFSPFITPPWPTAEFRDGLLRWELASNGRIAVAHQGDRPL